MTGGDTEDKARARGAWTSGKSERAKSPADWVVTATDTAHT
jgi:hypothetical protein